jgi:chromosome segregation ATPase
MSKNVKEYQHDLKSLDAEEAIFKKAIPTLEERINNEKAMKNVRELELKAHREKARAREKQISREFYQAERERARLARELNDTRKKLADIPRKRHYCQLKIKQLSAPKAEEKPKDRIKTKAKDGQGIETLADIV